MSKPARRVALALALVAVAVAAPACADEDPTLGAEVLHARCLAAAPPTLATTITGGRWTTSPCGPGPCELSLTIESTCVTFQALAADGEVLQLSTGSLTAEGRARGAALAGDLLGADIPELAGECGDEGPCEVRLIGLRRAGEGSTHELLGAVPPVLADAAILLDEVRVAMSECRSGPLVSVGGRCE